MSNIMQGKSVSGGIAIGHLRIYNTMDYLESITNMIQSKKVNAEYAVANTGDNFAAMFQAMDNAYMREHSADVKDISNRVITLLQGNNQHNIDTEEPSILLADDLAPSETVQLDKTKILVFVTRHGSSNSHTAILARSMNIPALDDFFDAHHPAILKMLQMVVVNGHKQGCWVGICGELGGDLSLTETLLKMGFDELSVNPSMILNVREQIRNADLR